jgi:ubiquinone/menaquinone biosynthesis C-methylase UbiE
MPARAHVRGPSPASEPTGFSDPSELPSYADQIAAFHRAFAGELRAIIRSLPLGPSSRVLDVGCGDGFYTALLAERLESPGAVVGIDINRAYLDLARRNPALASARCDVEFIAGALADLPLAGEAFDFVWCAQSLYSLPEPRVALQQMAAALKPGGLVAVLENDTLHEVLLPWPSHLEIALRALEYVALADESKWPGKFYVGRLLPALFAEAGLEPLDFRTQAIDRRAPLDADLEHFLRSYFERLSDRVAGHLDAALAHEFHDLIDPTSAHYLLHQPHFTLTWLNVLASARRPVG